MELIVTHESADFDAYASLVAAAKLHPSATPVLPYRLNRNVRAFHALYQGQLPLVEAEDLPEEAVQTVLLVDTRDAPPLKIIGPDAAISIVDHHPAEGDARDDGEGDSRVGATVTLLVEAMVAQGIEASPLEATVFALGLYEDTGRLTYAGTTPRDLRVAEQLLRWGAQLEVVRDYLNLPLSDELAAAYSLLAANTEVREVGGVTVAVSAAVLPEYVGELSALATRLESLYRPDVLFLVVEMDDPVQVIARSEAGSIDVRAVAEGLGGGGHARAAAALVRDARLADVTERVWAAVPGAMEPVPRVSQLMSWGVRVLEPDTRVDEAAELMARYGHEGFPVVSDGALRGVITRREVDRAMNHGLGAAPVRVYMRAEDVSVTPEDTVRELQRLMVEHDLGQVPVVVRGQVAGIVTRTDVIRSWAMGPAGDEWQAPSEQLWQTLPEGMERLLRQVGEQADAMGYQAYAVGGLVRDLQLGQARWDVDLVVEGDAAALARAMESAYGGRVVHHTCFGTATWFPPRVPDSALGFWPEHVDFATARTEYYLSPSALPTVESSSIRQDLQRRDFTINTLAMALSQRSFGQILDPFGGRRDLQDGVIRVLHSLSFVDDPTRMLRAVRLEARLGFQIEPRTEALILDAVYLLDRTSGERIMTELDLILLEDEAGVAIARLIDLGILSAILRGIAVSPQIAREMEAARRWAAWFAVDAEGLRLAYYALLGWDAVKESLEESVTRLHARREIARALTTGTRLGAALTWLASQGQVRPSQVVQALDGTSPAELLAAHSRCVGERERELLLCYVQEWRGREPQITGIDLRSWGLKPGPIYAQALWGLRAAVLDGEVQGRPAEEAWIRDWLAQHHDWGESSEVRK